MSSSDNKKYPAGTINPYTDDPIQSYEDYLLYKKQRQYMLKRKQRLKEGAELYYALENGTAFESGRPSKKKISAKDVLYVFTFFVAWFAGCAWITNILEYFSIPAASTIGCFGWSCCFGGAYYLSENDKKSITKSVKEEIDFLDHYIEIYDDAVDESIELNTVFPLYHAKEAVDNLCKKIRK